MREALQAALYASLNGAVTDLASAAVPVYDYVPQDTVPTFIRIGDSTESLRETKTRVGKTHLIEIDVYTSVRSYEGRKLVKHVMDGIDDVLHQTQLAVSGFNAQMLIFQFSTTFEEPDGVRGVIRFSTHITEV